MWFGIQLYVYTTCEWQICSCTCVLRRGRRSDLSGAIGRATRSLVASVCRCACLRRSRAFHEMLTFHARLLWPCADFWNMKIGLVLFLFINLLKDTNCLVVNVFFSPILLIYDLITIKIDRELEVGSRNASQVYFRRTLSDFNCFCLPVIVFRVSESSELRTAAVEWSWRRRNQVVIHSILTVARRMHCQRAGWYLRNRSKIFKIGQKIDIDNTKWPKEGDSKGIVLKRRGRERERDSMEDVVE